MRKPRCIGNPIGVVVYRENARIPIEPEVRQDIQCPECFRRNRIARRAVTPDPYAQLLLQDAFSPLDVFAKYFFAASIDPLMTVTMTADFMTRFENITDKLRAPLSHPT